MIVSRGLCCLELDLSVIFSSKEKKKTLCLNDGFVVLRHSFFNATCIVRILQDSEIEKCLRERNKVDSNFMWKPF